MHNISIVEDLTYDVRVGSRLLGVIVMSEGRWVFRPDVNTLTHHDSRWEVRDALDEDSLLYIARTIANLHERQTGGEA